MIHVEALGKRYGDKILFEDVYWHVKKRDRIGLSGPNGAGKTTLLRMLAGLEEPDSGSVRMASDTTIGYLPQDGIVHHGKTVYEEAVLAFEALLSLKEEQHRIEEALSHATPEGADQEHMKALERYAEVMEQFRRKGGYEIEAQVAEVLKGLGFSASDRERRTEEFSGGWQMRIALAKLLLARPNLLLMDEPTNHLDLPARNWLEEYLEDYPGSVVLVSHDRYFLDATVKRITEVGLKTLTDYHGNYSHYLVEHSARMENLREAHLRQKEEIERATTFISRFRYQATKARQVQSRIKMLEKVERIEIRAERKRIKFHFPDSPRPGRVVLELREARKAYGDLVVLAAADLVVERGDRIALVGPNGAGKSTLMRLLAGTDRPDAGSRLLGHQAVVEYFAQDQAAELNAARTVYEEMTQASPSSMVPMIRTILGGFLFSGDDVYKRVAVLSGGERNRLALAKMLLNPSNVLLLDEPTNHLDLDSKEVLLEALADYGGTLVFVSHDRYFVDRLADKVVDVGGGQALLYPGGYEDFLYWKKQRESGLEPPLPTRERRATPHLRQAEPGDGAVKPVPPAAKARPNMSPSPKKQGTAEAATQPVYDPLAPRLRPRGGAPDRQVRERDARKHKVRVQELEQRISAREQDVKDLEHLMTTPGFYEDRVSAERAVKERERLLAEVDALMAEWEALQTAGEAKG